MKMKKRILSFILSAALVLAFVPVAQAQEPAPDEGVLGGGATQSEHPAEPAEKPATADETTDAGEGQGDVAEDSEQPQPTPAADTADAVSKEAAGAPSAPSAPSTQKQALPDETVTADLENGATVTEAHARLSLWGNEGFNTPSGGNMVGLEDSLLLEYDDGVMTRGGELDFWLLGYGQGHVFAVPADTPLDEDSLLAAALPMDCWAADRQGVRGAFFESRHLYQAYGQYRVVFHYAEGGHFVVSQPLVVMNGRVDPDYNDVREARARVTVFNQENGETTTVHNGWQGEGKGYVALTDRAEVEFFEGYPCVGDYISLSLVPADVPLDSYSLRSSGIGVWAGWNSTGYDTQTVGDIYLEHAGVQPGSYRFVVETHGGMLVASQPIHIGEDEGTPPENTGDRFTSGDFEYEVTDIYAREVVLLGHSEAWWEQPHEEADLTIASTVTIGGEEFRVVEIAEDAFKYDGLILGLTIEEGIRTIGAGAFFNSQTMTSVSIPASVEYIGDECFNASYNLSTIIVAEDNPAYKTLDGVLLTKNGTALLCYPAGKTDRTAYAVPDTVTRLPLSAFAGGKTLTEVTLNEGLKSIAGSALNMSSLKTLHISSTVEDISYAAFYLASSLQTLTVAEGNPAYKAVDNVLFSKDGMALLHYPEGIPAESYAVPEGTLRIGTGAFWRGAFSTGALRHVTLPDSLTTIGNMAFRMCESLESVNIPAGVTQINPQAFLSCRSLAEVRCESPAAPTILSNAFLDIPAEATLYIPAGAEASYEANGWFAIFKNVETVEDGPATLTGIEITALPTRTAYHWGDRLDLAGLTVTATYSDGSTADVTTLATADVEDGYTFTEADDGVFPVTFSYTEGEIVVASAAATATLDLTVTEGAVSAVELLTAPGKTAYTVGEEFTAAGAQLTVTYANGYETTRAPDEAAPFRLTAAGSFTHRLTYGGQGVNIAYTVKNTPLAGLSVEQPPAKTQYAYREELDYAGLRVLAHYEAGEMDAYTLDVTDQVTLTPGGDTTDPAGRAIPVTAAYEEDGRTAKATFELTALPAVPVGIEITAPPAKTAYQKGEALDLAGLAVSACTAEGHRYPVDAAASPAAGALLDVTDTEVTLSYTLDGATFTASFAITVEDAAQPVTLTAIEVGGPTKTSYGKGDRLSLSGLTVTARYSDGTSKPVTNYTTSPANGAVLSTAGSQTVTVRYSEDGATCTASFQVEVKAPTSVAGQIWSAVKTVVNTVVNWLSRLFR